MDKSKLRNFAIGARVELIRRVTDRAARYGIDETNSAAGQIAPSRDYVKPGSGLLSPEEIRQRDALLGAVRARGFAQVMEEAAYTWFNRFIALRYMEAHGLLPLPQHVLPRQPGELPQIVREAQNVELGLDPADVLGMIERNENDALFRRMLIALCNRLHEPLPRMFEPISDYTELLFPDGLLRGDSVLAQMAALPEDSFAEIQVIGWLYQYYNTELKAETFELLKKNVKITKERIGAATQLFTPEWIVRYMVENSLGRLWLTGHADGALRERWRYYMDEAEQEPDVQRRLLALREAAPRLRPEEITLLDPCMGSGHILVYAFDLLMDIYRCMGYTDRDAAQSIVEHNLYGLDIDDRAAQLAYFAVMMKACEVDRRFLRRGVQPHVYAIRESEPGCAHLPERFGPLRESAALLLRTFEDAKEYGSILHVDLTAEELRALGACVRQMTGSAHTLTEQADAAELERAFAPLIEQAEVMARQYDVVVTNPPYMGSSGMSPKLARFVKEHYPDTKSDMSTVCMEMALNTCKPTGYVSMLNIPVWMFLSSYEKLRKGIISNNTIINMVHFGRGVFGSDFGTTSFVIAKQQIPFYAGTYRRLFDQQGAVDTVEQKEKWFFEGKGYFTAQQENFLKIPGAPVGYWVSGKLIDAFQNGISINDISLFTGSQNITANNEKYLRYIWEISKTEVGINKRWAFYIKGGLYRKWYGNIEFVVDWSDSALFYYETNPTSNLLAKEFRFKEGITYTELTSGINSFRYLPPIAVFDKKGPCIIEVKDNLYCLALFNSKVAAEYFKLLNPTITLQVRDVKNMPILLDDNKKSVVTRKTKECVDICMSDWDTFETSWD
ncbi:MAG: BREX-1 system adenine-specific DNA-methyltransferase PglX, partial [Clostridia bacterium]|nr:BREX-1 system adenine-specific DNA-methyltransferase PglX [Clostridia bacterium]